MDFICLDIETTGLNEDTDSIIEFCAVKFNDKGEILDEFETFIYYPNPIPVIIEHLTGINKSMTENAPKLTEVTERIKEICGDLPIVGHNISFDTGFLTKNGIPLPGVLLDTLTLSHLFLGDNLSFSLETLTRKFNKTHFPSHRAKDDVMANIELFITILNHVKKIAPQTNYLFKEILSKSDSKLCGLLSSILPEKTESPVYPKTKFKLPEPADIFASEPTLNKVSDQDLSQLISQKTCSSLFILGEHTLKSLEPGTYTTLPEFYSLISTEKFQTAFNEIVFSESEAIFMLKIANQILSKSPLYKSDINLFGSDFEFLGKLIEENYLIPDSTKPYTVDHFTFFKLIDENHLPKCTELHFEYVPFLEETYVRSREKRISLNSCEKGIQNDALTFAFGKLGIYASKLKKERDLNEYTPLVLDVYDFTSPDFTNFIKSVCESSNNSKVIKDIEELNKNFQKYLVWIYLTSENTPIISFIPKEINYDPIELIKSANISESYLHHASKQSHPFYIQTDLDLPDPNDYGYNNQLRKWLLTRLTNTTNQAVVVSPAKIQITDLHKHLAPELDKLGITVLTQDISGSKGKIMDNLQNNEGPTVLICTQHFLLRNKPPLPKLENLILTKLPMTLPGHIYYDYKKEHTQNSFQELTIPATAQTLYLISAFIKESNPDINQFTILDKRIITKDWGSSICSELPENIIVT